MGMLSSRVHHGQRWGAHGQMSACGIGEEFIIGNPLLLSVEQAEFGSQSFRYYNHSFGY
jgi:hypothetical protein